jgi:hypothetical protein
MPRAKKKPEVEAFEATSTVVQTDPPSELTVDANYDTDVITGGEVDLYETDPRLVSRDIVVCVEHPFILPANSRNITKRLKKGDRIRGKYYVELVTREKIEGLQLAYKLPGSFLEQLDGIRRERTGEKPPLWAVEAQALKR